MHVFILLFCREIDSGNAISVLLMPSMSISQTSDFALRILGRMNSNFSPESVAHDLCTVLQFMEVSHIEALQAHLNAVGTQGPTGTQAGASNATGSSLDGEDVPMCRLSMIGLQQRLKKYDRQEQRAHAAGVPPSQTLVELPCDLPLGAEAWGGYSCAQQQVVLLLASVRLDAIDDKDVHIAMVVSGRDRLSFTQYTTPRSKCDVVAAAVCLLLLRTGEVVDMHKLDTHTIMNTFTETCFEGVFGSSQLDIMTTAFHVQIYLIAFLSPVMRANCYNVVVATFNARIHKNKSHMLLPEYIPHTLCEKMSMFSTQHKLPLVIIEQVLKPLCV